MTSKDDLTIRSPLYKLTTEIIDWLSISMCTVHLKQYYSLVNYKRVLYVSELAQYKIPESSNFQGGAQCLYIPSQLVPPYTWVYSTGGLVVSTR